MPKYSIGIGLAAVAAVVIAVAVLLTRGHSATEPQRPPLHGSVTIGVLAPLSGTLADRGKDLAAGAAMAAADINARGGVLGRRVVVSVEDDQCAPDAATTGAQRLAAKPVAGVVGGVCDDATRAALDVLNASHTPLLITSANADSLVGNPYGFLLTGTVHQEALAAEHWIAFRTPQRVAVVDDDSPRSRELAGTVERRVRLDLPTTLTHAGAAGRAPALASALLRQEPELVYWTGAAAAGGRLVRALRADGYRGTFTASSASAGSDFLSEAGAGAAQGAYVMTTAGPQLLPTAAKWSVRYRAAYEREPGRDAMQAYDAVLALATAMRQARSPQSDAVAKGLIGLHGFSTFLSELTFAPDHSMTNDNHVVAVVKHGRFTLDNILRTQ